MIGRRRVDQERAGRRRRADGRSVGRAQVRGSSGPTLPGTIVVGRSAGSGRRPARPRAGQRADEGRRRRRDGQATCAARGRRVIRSRILSPHRPVDPPILSTMASGTVSDAFLDAVRAALPGPAAADRRGRPRVVPARRDGLPPERAAGRRGPAHGDGRGRPLVRLCGALRRPDRAARRRLGAERRRDRHRGRPDHRLHGHGPDPRDRHRQPVRRDPARDHQRPAQGRRRRARPVLRARTRPASRCARSAGTWAPTPVACAASSTARPATASWAWRS